METRDNLRELMAKHVALGVQIDQAEQRGDYVRLLTLEESYTDLGKQISELTQNKNVSLSSIL